jgi:hypothetical protein
MAFSAGTASGAVRAGCCRRCCQTHAELSSPRPARPITDLRITNRHWTADGVTVGQAGWPQPSVHVRGGPAASLLPWLLGSVVAAVGAGLTMVVRIVVSWLWS